MVKALEKVVVLRETELFKESIEISNQILQKSSNLRKAGADANIYVDKVNYLENLLGAEGYLNFNPVVTQNLVSDFKNSFPKRDDGHPNYANENHDTTGLRRFASYIFDGVTEENLLSNTVPVDTKAYIDHFELKGYDSPKLSKLLVKLWGEKSDVVNWYTNKCPKKLVKGVNNDYIVTLSILPHHITGMSYYSPKNHGGKRWIDGWEGSSCMDTVLNSEGENIYRLTPNLLDPYLAIAYLSDADDYDVMNPKYLARALVRVAKINENQWVMLGLRAYSVSNEAKSVLLEGLRNNFDNFTDVLELRRNHRDDVYNENMTKFSNYCKVSLLTEIKHTCRNCDGDGLENGETCDSCDGTGGHTETMNVYPYIDDSDFLRTTKNNSILMKLPKSWLDEKGYVKEEEVKTPRMYKVSEQAMLSGYERAVLNAMNNVELQVNVEPNLGFVGRAVNLGVIRGA